jgi:hypothetical protein
MMTKNAITLSNDHWLDRLEENGEDGNAQYKVIGMIVGGALLAGVTANPLLGILAGTVGLYQVWRGYQQREKHAEKLLEVRCVSPTLNAQELAAYRRQFGDEAVCRELVWAEMNEVPLQRHAIDFLDWVGEFQPQKYQEVIDDLTGGYVPVEAEAIAQIEAEEQCLEIQQTQAETMTTMKPVAAESKQSKTAFNVLIESPYSSRAFFGAQRTGKTYLAALATQELARKSNQIFHINLASFGNEDSEYWSHAQSVRCDLATCDEADAVDAIQKAIALVEKWFASTNAILVVDEFAYIGSTGNSYAGQLAPLMQVLSDKISALASTGIKRAKSIWTIAPEFVAGGLTQEAKAVKKLQLVYVSIAPGKFVDWQGSKISFDGSLFDQIGKNFPIAAPAITSAIAGQDRIVYANNVWMPVGVDKVKLQSSNLHTETALHLIKKAGPEGISGIQLMESLGLEKLEAAKIALDLLNSGRAAKHGNRLVAA